MQQVDDFAIAAPDAHTSDILMDLIVDQLKIPIKQQGYLDMYNGVDVTQTRYYIKINVKTYINKIFKPYFTTWTKTSYPSPARSTPLLLEEEVPTELKVLLTLTGTLTSLLKHTTEDPAPGCLSKRRIVKMIYFKL